MPEKMVRYIVQIVAPEGSYDGCDDLIADLTALIEGESEIEVVSVEEDLDKLGDGTSIC